MLKFLEATSKKLRNVEWFRPMRTLHSKIVLTVFGTTVLASFAFAWVSVHSIRSSLADEINQEISWMLIRATQGLDTWYSQRQHEIQGVARSSALQESITQLTERYPSDAATVEIEQHLEDVLERFPQYRSLFVLSREEGFLVEAGDPVGLPENLRGQLSQTTIAGIDEFRELGLGPIQLVFAPIVDASKRHLASLYAAIDPAVAAAALERDNLSEFGAFYVVASEGEILMKSPGAPRTRYSRPLPLPGAFPTVEVYESATGEVMVSSSVYIPEFGWSVAVEEPYNEFLSPVRSVVHRILMVNAVIILICCTAAYRVSRSVARPIRGLSNAALQVAVGDTEVIFPSHTDDDIGVLGRTFNEMMSRLRANQIEIEDNRVEIEEANSRLIAQNRELQRVTEVFHQLSITDGLTKLHNHRFFQDHLPREMKRSTRTGEPLCLILIDIDNFKELNDQHGHSVGDAVLMRVAEVMNRAVREMDLLARYGGEEFALLASQTSLEGATALAEKIRLSVSNSLFPVVNVDKRCEIAITVSIGVAPYRGDQKAFFNDADRALYRAKAAGKDCVVVSDIGEDEAAV